MIMDKAELIHNIKEFNKQKATTTLYNDSTIEYSYVLDMLLPDKWYHFLFNISTNESYYVPSVDYYRISCSYVEMCNLVKMYSPEDLQAWKLYFVVVNGIDDKGDPEFLKEQFEIYKHFSLIKLATIFQKSDDLLDIDDSVTTDVVNNYHRDKFDMEQAIDDKDIRITNLESKIEELEKLIYRVEADAPKRFFR